MQTSGGRPISVTSCRPLLTAIGTVQAFSRSSLRRDSGSGTNCGEHHFSIVHDVRSSFKSRQHGTFRVRSFSFPHLSTTTVHPGSEILSDDTMAATLLRTQRSNVPAVHSRAGFDRNGTWENLPSVHGCSSSHPQSKPGSVQVSASHSRRPE